MLSVEDVSALRQVVQLFALLLMAVGMLLSLMRGQFGMVLVYLAFGGLIVAIPLLVAGPVWVSTAIITVIAALSGLNMYYKFKLGKRAQAVAPKDI